MLRRKNKKMKTLPEITAEIGKIFHEEFFVNRKEDSFHKTITEIINVCINLLTLNIILLTKPEKRKEFFDDQFPFICDGSEKTYYAHIKLQQQDETSCA